MTYVSQVFARVCEHASLLEEKYNCIFGQQSTSYAGHARSPFSEIWIHQAIHKRYPSINSVIHSHSRAVLPFADTGVPLVPQFNLEAVIGREVPVFDIADYYLPNETHNFLVNLPHLGAALADTFSTPQNNATKQNSVPDYPVVLQRAHGLSAAAISIQHAVWAAWSAQDAANVASESLAVLGAYQGSAARLTQFSEQELRDSMALGQSGEVKDWPWFIDQIQNRRLQERCMLMVIHIHGLMIVCAFVL